MVTLDGDTAPLAPIVIVAPLGPGLPLTGLGLVPPPPQANAASIADATAHRLMVDVLDFTHPL
jgi:hypothetical protein